MLKPRLVLMCGPDGAWEWWGRIAGPVFPPGTATTWERFTYLGTARYLTVEDALAIYRSVL